MQEQETKRTRSHNARKLRLILTVCILIISLVLVVCGIVCYNRHQKNSPEYILNLIGKAFVTGDEKYVSALEEKLDSEQMSTAILERIKMNCFQEKYPESNTISIHNSTFLQKFPVIAKQVDNIIYEIRGSTIAEYNEKKLWPAKIEKIEYFKRRVDGKLTDVAIATIKMHSGFVFQVRLDKEKNVWIPENVNSEDNICQWISKIEKYANTEGIAFEDMSTMYTIFAIRGGPENLAKFEESYEAKSEQKN